MTVIQDITEKKNIEIDLKQVEETLIASERQHRRIIETANEGIWFIDQGNRTSLVNPKMRIEAVRQAGDGKEALALARRLNPHVILMDISMPEMDGEQATRLIWASKTPSLEDRSRARPDRGGFWPLPGPA
jgi:CheY-like chemotaxis protein